MKNGDYELIVPPPNYPGKKYRNRYAYVHHVSWWEKTGHVIKKGFCIHHIDGDKSNNSPDNLIEIQERKHKQLHQTKTEKDKNIIIKCYHCCKDFLILIKNHKHKTRLGQKSFYCSRSCVYASLRK